LKDPVVRENVLLELVGLVDLSHDSIAPEIDILIDGIRQETSNKILAVLWDRLAKFPQARLRAFAESELTAPDGLRRLWAVQYLGRAFPTETRPLYERMANDPDPFVLHELGNVIVASDRRAALELWDKAMTDAPQGLANEVLPALIGQYADAEFIERLRENAQKPYDELSRMALWQANKWNSVDYLNPKKTVEPGRGYWVPCPHCGNELGIRDGHEGERARCKPCGQEFAIPSRHRAK
jgi:hypothetical protein